MSRHERPARIYVGNLPNDVREREIEDLFSDFGRIRDIDIKKGRTSNGTAFGFVEFESMREADEAIDERDGYRFGNLRLRVELSGERGARRQSFRGGPPKRTEFRVIVTGLPTSASWQDLKDHMRMAGPVGFADARDGRGVVEYETEEDMRYAIRKLDRSEFRNPFTRCCIRVRAEADEYHEKYRPGDRRRSRSHSGRSRRRSHDSRSPRPTSPRSVSRSRSPRTRTARPTEDRYHSPREERSGSVARSTSPRHMTTQNSASDERKSTGGDSQNGDERKQRRSHSGSPPPFTNGEDRVEERNESRSPLAASPRENEDRHQPDADQVN